MKLTPTTPAGGRENGPQTRRRCHHLLPLAPEAPREGCLANTDVAIRELDDLQNPACVDVVSPPAAREAQTDFSIPAGTLARKLPGISEESKNEGDETKNSQACSCLSGKPEGLQRAIKITAVLFGVLLASCTCVKDYPLRAGTHQ